MSQRLRHRPHLAVRHGCCRLSSARPALCWGWPPPGWGRGAGGGSRWAARCRLSAAPRCCEEPGGTDPNPRASVHPARPSQAGRGGIEVWGRGWTAPGGTEGRQGCEGRGPEAGGVLRKRGSPEGWSLWGEEGFSQASRSGWGGNGSLWLLTGEGGSRVRGWVGSSVQIHGFLLLSAPFKELCAGAFCASFWGPAKACVQNEEGIETLLKKITVSEKYTSNFRYYCSSDLCQDTDSFPTYCRTLVESLELESPFWRHQSCDPRCCPTRLIPQEQGVCRNTLLHIWSYTPVATIIL